MKVAAEFRFAWPYLARHNTVTIPRRQPTTTSGPRPVLSESVKYTGMLADNEVVKPVGAKRLGTKSLTGVCMWEPSARTSRRLEGNIACVYDVQQYPIQQPTKC